MGSLHYGGQEFEFDDRTLTHLQIVFSTKLRRGENCVFSWISSACSSSFSVRLLASKLSSDRAVVQLLARSLTGDDTSLYDLLCSDFHAGERSEP